MAYYYKVPAVRDYEEETVEVKEGERLSKDEEVFEEDGKRHRNVVTDKVIGIRPDIPPGYSYVCELLEDGETFFVKSDKPIRFAKGREAQTESIKSLDAVRKDAQLSRVDTSRVQQRLARGGR